MKRIHLSRELVKKIKETKNKDKKLYKKIQKQLDLFQNNPHHPSLRIHKLSGGLKNTWSISIDRDCRMIYQDNDWCYFFDLGTHDQVYRK